MNPLLSHPLQGLLAALARDGHLQLAAALATLSWPRLRSRPLGADEVLLERLREGDEQAFLELVSRHNGLLLRVARTFVREPAVAEEVVQDTWLGVLRGIDAFAGRASLRTWLLSILVNRARSTGVSERRRSATRLAAEPAVPADRFDAGGAWSAPPRHWVDEVDDRVFAESLAAPLRAALDDLPQRQREVVVLRDVDGLSAAEVCAVLEISEANQRVLLHRGRSRLRAALESELG